MKKYLLAVAVLMSIACGAQAQGFGEAVARAVGNTFGTVIGNSMTSAECAASAFGTAAIQKSLTGSKAVGGYAGSSDYSQCAALARYRREREQNVQDSFRYRMMEEQYRNIPRWSAHSTTSVHNGQVSHQAVVNQSAGGFGALPVTPQRSIQIPEGCREVPFGPGTTQFVCN